jgi:alpha-beta hydrolase superfamily lysophospholipase
MINCSDPRAGGLRGVAALLILVLGVGVSAVGCGGTSVPGPSAAAPAEDAFYSPPTPIPPGRPGDVLRRRGWAAVPGARTTLVLYRSTDVRGAPVAVSGVVAVPDGGHPPAGGWPVLAWAHGTTGLADGCAPSRYPRASDARLIQLIGSFTARGFAVAATDYQGLGTPGGHPYVVGLSEGRSVLDMARAAARLPDTGVRTTSPVVAWGHSQGGGAAVFTAEMQPAYAPDVPLKGAVVGAPAAELRLLGTALQRSPFFGYLFMVAAGYRAAYPDLPLDRVLTPTGMTMLGAAERECSDGVLDQVRGQDPARFIRADVGSIEPFASVLERNTPGNTPTPVPMFVYQGDADEQIPVAASQLMVNRMCRHGGFTVHRVVLPGQDHVGSIWAVMPQVQRWIDDRLAGRPAPADCPK